MSKKSKSKTEEWLKKSKKDSKDSKRRSSVKKRDNPPDDDDDDGFQTPRFAGREDSVDGKKLVLANFLIDSVRYTGSSRRSKEGEKVRNERHRREEPEREEAYVPIVTEDRVKFGRDDVENNNVYNYRVADVGKDDKKRKDPEESHIAPIYFPRLTGIQREPISPIALATVYSIPKKPQVYGHERQKSEETQSYYHYLRGRNSPTSTRRDSNKTTKSSAQSTHHPGPSQPAKVSHGESIKRKPEPKTNKDPIDKAPALAHEESKSPTSRKDSKKTTKPVKENSGTKEDKTHHFSILYDGQGIEERSTTTLPILVQHDPWFNLQGVLDSKSKDDNLTNSTRKQTGPIVASQVVPGSSRKPTLLEEQTPENIAKHFAKNPPHIMRVHVELDKKPKKTKKTASKSKIPKKKSTKKPPGPAVQPSKAKVGASVTETNLSKKLKNLNSNPSKKKKKAKKTSSEPFLDITDFDSYYNYVYGEKFVEPSDKEDEWMDLSTTDNQSERLKIKSFEKGLPAWMLEGLSYESQNLARTMRFFEYLCLLTGRKFYFNVPNFYKGHVDFIVSRPKQIPFFLSTFIMWTSLVLMLGNLVDVVVNSSEDDSSKVAKLELRKYYVFLVYIILNLVLVSVWSLIVILQDCHVISHYFNCWCAALAEMETTGAIEIEKITYINFLVWLLAAVILTLAFVFDFPETLRGTSGVVSMLLFRGIIPNVRIRDDDEFLQFQIAGLVFILYVMFCSRMLFCLMQILSLIIKNSAEMWNFKFALTFDQLLVNNRGHMLQITLNFPLYKIFSHHRILTALLKIYGEVFAVPISIYIVSHMTIFTTVLLNVFWRFDEQTDDDYKDDSKTVYEFRKIQNQNLTRFEILNDHSSSTVLTTAVYVLFQVLFDFLYTTEIITNATRAFFDGFEFVRRTSIILCEDSHQRRVIQSLLWSMSSTDASLLTAANYYSLTKETIASSLSIAIVFFSLIIQLRNKNKAKAIEIEKCADEIHGDRCIGRAAGGPVPDDPDDDLYILKLHPH